LIRDPEFEYEVLE
jgi:hypothetical protein